MSGSVVMTTDAEIERGRALMNRRSVVITTGLAEGSALTVDSAAVLAATARAGAFELTGATAGAELCDAVFACSFPAANAGEDADNKKPTRMLGTRLCEKIIRVGWVESPAGKAMLDVSTSRE